MSYQTAKEIKDAYFTKLDTAKWCLNQLANLYKLEGKTALEPACGSGSFVTASKETGLVWKTNELFPEFSQGFQHDFNLDFAKDKLGTLGTYDFVISNPPFGHASSLAKKFVKRGFEVAKVVAMLLPKGCRRGSAIDTLPRNVKVILDVDVPDTTFILPDGKEKKVGCVFMVFEQVEGYTREPLLDYEPVGYRAESGGQEWPEWATHGVGLLMGAGVLLTKGGRERGYLDTLWLELNDEQAEKFLTLDLKWLVARTQTSIPRIVKPEVLTELNKLF